MGKKTIGSVISEYIVALAGSGISEKIMSALKQMGLYYPVDSSLNAAVYMKLFGSELASFGLWEQDIRGFIGTGEWLTDIIKKVLMVPKVKMDILKTVSLVDNAISIPTPAGLPLAIKLDVVALVHVKGSASFTGIQAITELLTGMAVTKPVTGAIVMDTTLAFTYFNHSD